MFHQSSDQSKKEELPELTKKLIEGGVLHEEEYVKNLHKLTIDENLSEDDAEKQTLKHMKDGAELIYQGVISYIDGDIKYKAHKKNKTDLLTQDQIKTLNL